MLAGLYTRDAPLKMKLRAYTTGATVALAFAYYLYVVILDPT